MNVRAFISKNLLAIVMVPAIIGGHYTWYKLQQDDRLVSKEERDKIPMITFFKKLGALGGNSE
ncbi:uncharacterized protein LOC133528692 isoform X1 [Cydia pomonella]|uniref:uncharacterized protein LOC133528692 isoform X1 n=1 Tax=Cydia pomonella TaxID=82600 RepID=UPI002ADDBCDD|nr:uncharacterized protein LOC133528692 isoform X1 [Cydia pomonella]